MVCQRRELDNIDIMSCRGKRSRTVELETSEIVGEMFGRVGGGEEPLSERFLKRRDLLAFGRRKRKRRWSWTRGAHCEHVDER
jgi:hypothetical protein